MVVYIIYLDNAATTRPYDEVTHAVCDSPYGNPGSLHSVGLSARMSLSYAREQIAMCIHATPEHIVFTSGGSESNTTVFQGMERHFKSLGKTHIITTKIEHHSVLENVKKLEQDGFTVTYLDVDIAGHISMQQLANSITSQTCLVSVMCVNNEIGSRQDIAEIGKLCAASGVLFHSDCVQALGSEEIDVESMHVDFASFSAHKIHGPKGIGCLYVRDPSIMDSIIHGGGQEFGKRSGTENVSGARGFGVAASKINYRAFHSKSLLLSNLFLSKLRNNQIHTEFVVNGESDRNGKILNIRFPGIPNENLILTLSMNGVCVSGGSACSSRDGVPSHVLKAIGLTGEEASESIRISFSDMNTEEEVSRAADIVALCAANTYKQKGVVNVLSTL